MEKGGGERYSSAFGEIDGGNFWPPKFKGRNLKKPQLGLFSGGIFEKKGGN